ncbi:MAG: hypothetical protein WD512_06770, partial [Candidatus Paceibacterota bacterium]
MLNPKEPWKRNIIAFYLITGFGLFFTLYGANNILHQGNISDPPNLFTLILEIGIGIIITVTVFAYSKRQQFHIETLVTQIQIQQNQIKNLVTEIKNLEDNQQKIIDGQLKFKKERENYAYQKLMSLFTMIYTSLQKLKEGIIDEELERNEDGETVNVNWFDYSKALIDDAESVLNQYSDILNTHVTNDVTNICKAVKPKNKHHKEYDDIIELLENTLNRLEKVSGLERPVLRLSYRTLQNTLNSQNDSYFSV